MGLIVGNRGVFPSHLCESGRQTMLRVLEEEGINVVALSPEETEFGTVSTLQDARKCGELFKAHAEQIDGVLVTLPNFGEERGVADAIRFSRLDVPVLVHAFPDDVPQMNLQNRRDSFCGKMSVCNNLRQYGIPFSLTERHTVDPASASFRQDVGRFAATCRVVKGLREARVGVIGARPADFKTVRFSEKLLEHAGISVDTIDLSEVFGRARNLQDENPAVQRKLEALQEYIDTDGVPSEPLLKMAKLGAVIDSWMEANGLVASALQCWTAMEEFYGVVPCSLMSLMSNELLPSACETDITGVVGMYALALASGKPSAIVDWNNNYGADPNKAVIFHCSNLPVDLFVEEEAPGGPRMDYQEIIAGNLGKENAYGAVLGRVKASPVTYLRVSTDDIHGQINTYVGEGALTDDPLETFGGFGVIQVPHFQELLRFICANGFEHHVAINPAQTAAAVHEALSKYLGWESYYHQPAS